MPPSSSQSKRGYANNGNNDTDMDPETANKIKILEQAKE